MFYPRGEYVEGWLAYETEESVKVVEHCWCELVMDGLRRILDPSIVFLVEEGQPVWYFPGVRRSWQETGQLQGEWFPHVLFETYGEDGLDHPGYRAAHDEAIARGRQLSQAATPPKELVVHTAQYVPEEVLAALGDDAVYIVLVPRCHFTHGLADKRKHGFAEILLTKRGERAKPALLSGSSASF